MQTTVVREPETGGSRPRAPHRLPCMEIWGGNQAIDDAVSVPGVDTWVYSRPFRDQSAGGDIHYISTCGGGKIARFAVADVAGHGAAVSMLARELRGLMRRYINTLDQTHFIRALNRAFSERSAGRTFATALLTTYFAPTDHLITCNAGHPPPLWYRSRSKTWRWLEHSAAECVSRVSNLPLGVVEPTDYTQFAVPLDRDDLVLIYSDAFPESRSLEGRALGQDGLLELAGRIDPSTPERFGAELLDAASAYRGGGPVDDDLTLMILHHNAASPPRQSIGETIRVIGKMLHLVRV